MGFLIGLAALFGMALFIVGICFLSMFYEWIKRKVNRPKIGLRYFNPQLIKRDDYVGWENGCMQFSHFASKNESINLLVLPDGSNFTAGNELAFQKELGLGYIYIKEDSLLNCKYIFGKYGIKWALSPDWEMKAKKKYKELY